jgi:hypothetical protein
MVYNPTTTFSSIQHFNTPPTLITAFMSHFGIKQYRDELALASRVTSVGGSLSLLSSSSTTYLSVFLPVLIVAIILRIVNVPRKSFICQI